MKTILTNYGQPGKNITQSRDAIRADLRALGLRLDERTSGAALWLAYPLPLERDSDWRADHLRRIEADALSNRRIATIKVGQTYVHVYLSVARPAAVGSASLASTTSSACSASGALPGNTSTAVLS